jgi:hypothetical protein
MKRLLGFFIIFALLVMAGPAIAGEKQEDGPLKFKVTITAKFDAIDLKELANLESRLREIFKKSNLSISIDFDKECPKCPDSYNWSDGKFYLD